MDEYSLERMDGGGKLSLPNGGFYNLRVAEHNSFLLLLDISHYQGSVFGLNIYPHHDGIVCGTNKPDGLEICGSYLVNKIIVGADRLGGLDNAELDRFHSYIIRKNRDMSFDLGRLVELRDTEKWLMRRDDFPSFKTFLSGVIRRAKS
ncbi:hypothetical protein J4230_00215 [Candidatus Woesearchaeota archaeon]|nr:hypothetical protein [Candidatus Woesearchaeota archaeon]